MSTKANNAEQMKLSSISLISGLSLGLEFVAAIPEEDIPDSVILDLLVFRFLFTVGEK